MLTAGVRLSPTRYDQNRANAFFRESLTRIGALPGVEHVAGAGTANGIAIIAER